VFSADRGRGVRGTFLVDRDGIVRFAEVNAPGEPRDQDAWTKALASRRRAFRCPSSCSTCVLIRKGALCNSVPQRRLLNWAQTILRSTLHLVREPADQRGFAVIRGRWAVERTSAWLTAHRRLARDRERDPATSEAMIRWAAINIITRRIARGGPRHPTAEAHFHHGKLIFTYTL
jgi:transposase